MAEHCEALTQDRSGIETSSVFGDWRVYLLSVNKHDSRETISKLLPPATFPSDQQLFYIIIVHEIPVDATPLLCESKDFQFSARVQ